MPPLSKIIQPRPSPGRSWLLYAARIVKTKVRKTCGPVSAMLPPPREGAARRGSRTMSDPRQELLRHMAALRRNLDPKVVERLDLAAEGKVPYDRETAQIAVRQFLATRTDDGKFQKKLVEALKKGGGKD